MAAKRSNSLKQTPNENKNIGKTASVTPDEALAILANALKQCEKAGIEVKMFTAPYLAVHLPKVQAIDGKLVME